MSNKSKVEPRPQPASDAELLRLVHQLRNDPCRKEAFAAVDKLSAAARDSKSDVWYTYNKLLWLMGM